ncbi:hypothetical protein EHS13_02325 [Paenibacillus psychroresistens]|uniref:Uncharacterized protein n=1 Tax=Paenibacillus psychroresistens TaxID=1778678 RepID=A0A6B8RE97_9BACL|nr:hypothetical protein [Paenibacillus psychroresistens]QGQ93823.1 hypothetical protein EHS13_02325 [Paenibacillus psychroresistens]
MILWEHFDKNEWFVLVMLIVTYSAIIILPKRVSTSLLILGLVWGFASSTLFDFTIGGGLLDYYRVNDSNHYELTDLFTYFMFAPFGYFFIYFYEVLRISKKTLLYYIVGWIVIGLAFQWLAGWMEMTHYQQGYKPAYNIIVFLIVQSITGLFYRYIKGHPVKSGVRGELR